MAKYMGEMELLKPTFRWILDLVQEEDSVIHSPTFWSSDSTMIKHEWRLEIQLKHVPGTCQYDDWGDEYYEQAPVVHVEVTLKYQGSGSIQANNVWLKVIKSSPQCDLRASSSNGSILYDEASQSKSQNKVVFSESNASHKIKFSLSSISYPIQIAILCEMSAQLVTASNVNFLTPSSTDHDNDLKNDYEFLLTNGKFSDVTVSIAKQELHLNKSILSKRSPVFAAMFDHELKENVTNIVYIEDFSYDVMLEFFRFMYAAKVDSMEKYMADLLRAAEKYEVEGLKSLCEQSMAKALNPDNALEYLIMANLHNAQFLEAQCMEYVVLNAKSIVKRPNYDLSQVPVDLVTKLFSLLALKSPSL
ncbi:hypothetical protein QAD02_016605 [Eretmocerus hayati]|uniref:Uncharacterized protein n=1 Tax=Eretmocerus hayati TaxID=131215 RepID=A0ACC2PCM0_9HYME|nr:hypothetical protein QAD02_016605 [Eretmocerus hayati]